MAPGYWFPAGGAVVSLRLTTGSGDRRNNISYRHPLVGVPDILGEGRWGVKANKEVQKWIWLILFIIGWLGCFIVVAVDSAMRGISTVFWRVAACFGGPFVLLAYGVVRELGGKK